MQEKLIPVVLKFRDVASNSNINFTFSSVGASWCLGADSGDALGFSYDVMTGDGREATSFISSVEFNNSVLAIRTADTGSALNRFNLTLFLRVQSGVDFVQGYCTLNNEARVMAFFGNERPVQWRNGRISAVLRQLDLKYRSIFLLIEDARPGNKISVNVGTKSGLGKVSWSLGPEFSEASGLRLSSSGSGMPVASFSYTENCLQLETVAGKIHNDDRSITIWVRAYITWEPLDLEYLYLKAQSNADISVYAQIGNRQPQLVSQTNTLFSL